MYLYKEIDLECMDELPQENPLTKPYSSLSNPYHDAAENHQEYARLKCGEIWRISHSCNTDDDDYQYARQCTKSSIYVFINIQLTKC